MNNDPHIHSTPLPLKHQQVEKRKFTHRDRGTCKSLLGVLEDGTLSYFTSKSYSIPVPEILPMELRQENFGLGMENLELRLWDANYNLNSLKQVIQGIL